MSEAPKWERFTRVWLEIGLTNACVLNLMCMVEAPTREARIEAAKEIAGLIAHACVSREQ